MTLSNIEGHWGALPNISLKLEPNTSHNPEPVSGKNRQLHQQVMAEQLARTQRSIDIIRWYTTGGGAQTASMPSDSASLLVA